MRGRDVPPFINLPGYIVDRDDFNDQKIPYNFVRPFFIATGQLDGQHVVLGLLPTGLASLAGVTFYKANGFEELGRSEAVLMSGKSMACVLMRKQLKAFS